MTVFWDFALCSLCSQPDYKVQNPRRLSPSYSLPWEPEISPNIVSHRFLWGLLAKLNVAWCKCSLNISNVHSVQNILSFTITKACQDTLCTLLKNAEKSYEVSANTNDSLNYLHHYKMTGFSCIYLGLKETDAKQFLFTGLCTMKTGQFFTLKGIKKIREFQVSLVSLMERQ
jgi:hypothetical protein